ncbi:FecR domain-containing protein [Aurantimonas sp. 22II-16-19i]|uniref:FecR domain-containing protein n=1 Tax=Aurantimonas sp. 22II-16-19i TaxID=1317114 RepID=UPI001FD98D8F|nr:FecR domain-containing protein [Aurantimonas sp. 22II-16-19i]
MHQVPMRGGATSRRTRRTGGGGRLALVLLPILMAAMTMAMTGAAQAQTLPGCSATTLENPARQVLDCGNGLVIDKEAAAALASQTPQRSLELDERAVLIQVSPRDSFQVLTPHAIATVRGTTFAVDVETGLTSVFVVEGSVAVEQRTGSDAVLLGPGDGVDVRPGEPLVVRQWPQLRADALLARLGR